MSYEHAEKPCRGCGDGIPYDPVTVCAWCSKDEDEAYFQGILNDPPDRQVLTPVARTGASPTAGHSPAPYTGVKR